MLPADVADAAQVEAVAAEVLKAFGRCDILVDSAGLNIRERAWDAVDAPGFDSVIAANLNSGFYASRAVLPAMRAQGGGLIIQVSSWGGRYVSPVTGPAYTAAKAGLKCPEREPQPGGGRERHPLLLHLPGRGGHADPAEPTHSGERQDRKLTPSRRADVRTRPP